MKFSIKDFFSKWDQETADLVTLFVQCAWFNCRKTFDDFKIMQKSVRSNILWYLKVYIFWKFIQYTIRWDKTQILKKVPSDKINVTKNALFFISWAPIHHNFTFNLRFLYELKHKVYLSKSICGIFHFRFHLFFIKFYILVQQKAWTLWL